MAKKKKESAESLLDSIEAEEIEGKEWVVSNEEILEDKEAKECKELKLFPNKLGVAVRVDQKVLLGKLIGRKLSKDSIIRVGSLKSENDFFSSFFDDIENPFVMHLNVMETKPKGVILIDEKTKIEIVKKPIRESDLEDPKIVKVQNLSKEYNKKLELSSIDDLRKAMVEGYFFNRYESKDKIIYFNSEYFFEIKKDK